MQVSLVPVISLNDHKSVQALEGLFVLASAVTPANG